METIQTTIRIPKDLHEFLSKLASDEKRSLMKQIEYALEKFQMDQQ